MITLTVSYKAIKRNMLLKQYLPEDNLICACGGTGLDHHPKCSVGIEESRSIRHNI
jgi:hypothetical protein